MSGDRERGELIFSTMEKMGYRAATPGEKDLSFGMEFYGGLAKKHHVKLISANVFDPISQELLFPAYSIYTVEDMRVGVFGLLSPTLTITQIPGEATPEVHDAIEAARALVPKLRGEEKCDAVVALLHMPNAQAAELLKLVPGIDLAVYGHDSGIRSDLEKVENTMVTRTGDRGQRVAVVDVVKGAPGEPAAVSGEVVLLGEGLPENTALATALKLADDDIKDRVGLENAKLVAQRELARGDDHYLGDVTCARCHQVMISHWAGTGHARAWMTLEEKHEEKNSNCIACHSTGYAKGGFEDVHGSPDLRNVQCESCHGMGTSHGPGYATAAKASCATCHTAEMSPNFDYKTAWKKIQHPKESAAITPENGTKG